MEAPTSGDPGDDVALARAGDRAALERVLRANYDRIYAVCRRITGDDSDGADAAQEAMIAIVRGIGRFDGRSAFATWAYRIATNASLDELRRRRRRPQPLDPTDAAASGHEVEDSGASAPIESLGDRLQLDGALRQLAEEFRVAVVLRDVGGLDYGDIASIVGVPVGTVKSRIARGRAALAANLGGNRAVAAERPREAP